MGGKNGPMSISPLPQEDGFEMDHRFILSAPLSVKVPVYAASQCPPQRVERTQGRSHGEAAHVFLARRKGLGHCPTDDTTSHDEEKIRTTHSIGVRT